MEATAATMEADSDGFQDLRQQLMDKRSGDSEQKNDKAPEREEPRDQNREADSEEKEPKSSVKKYSFRKGDQVFEVDEDAEFEMMADKKPIKLTLRDLKDRAAGEIAVKNRMHSLAEEKKRVQSTFKEFTELAKDDPLGALEYIASKANETDSEFEYNKYLSKLAEQAEKLGSMDEKERKAWELEKKLNKANQDLSLKEREASVVRKKQEILEKFPEIGDQKFGQMVEAVMNDESLVAECENEGDVLAMTERLIEESLLQADIADLIEEFDPGRASDNELIFAIRDQVVQNPDFDEDDVREILAEVLGPAKKERAARTLSQKQRTATTVEHSRREGATDFDLLKEQLEERREEQRNHKR